MNIYIQESTLNSIYSTAAKVKVSLSVLPVPANTCYLSFKSKQARQPKVRMETVAADE